MEKEAEGIQKLKILGRPLLIVAAVLSVLPILLTPPLMDVRFWFTEYVSEMNYSASNIYDVWQAYLQPGRFVPLSDLYVFTYAYIGHKFLQLTQAPVSLFDLITKVTLLLALFFSLRSLVKALGLGLSRELASNYSLILFTIWGLGANVFWKLNGTVSYPAMIYPTIIMALFFASWMLREIELGKATGFKLRWKSVTLIALSSIWANFYYELAYMAIVAIVVAIIVAPTIGFVLRDRLKLVGLVSASFLAIWIPMRIILARQCSANVEACYEGSQLNLIGMPATLIKNVVNGLPLTDYSALSDIEQGKLPLQISGVTFFMTIFVALAIFASLLAWYSKTQNSKGLVDEVLRMQVRLSAVLLSMGVTGAGIMSVSLLSQQTVDWGYAYRHAPILWLAYASVLLTLITWITHRSNLVLGAILLISLVATLTFGQWGRSFSVVRENNKDFEPVSRLYHELYNADTRMAGLGNDRRCLIIEELSSKEVNLKRYVEPAEIFMTTFHNVPFCKQ